ncbi:hypothetical protein LBMAG42_19020 [Deltaproteobacteria bacterium]|nr:hypothetical protein LBMAG42_19020 [Deltaproteobacteria bacterium]
MFSTLALLLSASPSFAGGFGLFGTGGVHGDRVYYYAENSIGEAEQQAPLDEINSNGGGGLELILGDKDYKINGFFRFYFLADAPVTAPPDADQYTFNLRTEEWRPLGVVDAGLQFGLVGEPERFQLCLIGLLGSAVMTEDQTEFLQAQAGVGVTYTFARHFQAHAEVDGGIRYRKRLYPTVNASAGLRYLFD